MGKHFYKSTLKNLVILNTVPIPSKIDLNLEQNLIIHSNLIRQILLNNFVYVFGIN